jgi:transposase-like protein
MEVVASFQRSRRWTPEEKLGIFKQSNEPGSFVFLVARQHGLTAAQLFQLRKAYIRFLGRSRFQLNCRTFDIILNFIVL